MQSLAAGDARDRLVRSHCAAPGERTLADVAQRVSAALALVEPPAARAEWRDRCFELIDSTRLLPSVPILSNTGVSNQLAACFALEAADSLDSIYATLARAARIQQGSGGTGIELSALRPRGTPIARSGGGAPGPVGFLELFATSARVNRSSGRRPGAHLAILRADHPDALAFVRAKRERPGELSGLGLAISASDAFLAAAHTCAEIPLMRPDGTAHGAISARLLLDEICRSIHATGEPSLLFSGALERGNPVPELGPLRATNPCGEQPLLPGESCVLASLHLPAFARASGELDLAELGRTAEFGVRLLDDVIDANQFPDPGVAEISRRTRKIGLGVMGLADVFLLRGLTYDCPEASDLASVVMGCVAQHARAASEQLARERGPFPAQRPGSVPRRNASLLAIAPTGVVSLIAGCSAGIEPFIWPTLRLEGGVEWRDLWLAGWLSARGADSPEVWDAIAEGAPAAELAVGAMDRSLLRRAWEIDPRAQIRVQAAIQEQVDGAVSKTVHLAETTAPDEIRELILLAHRLGCKGVALYRRRCSPPVPMHGS